jgi:antitoxin HicB
MHKQHKTKPAMARELNTSRSQLDRLLDPTNVSVSLDTIACSQGIGRESDFGSRVSTSDERKQD